MDPMGLGIQNMFQEAPVFFFRKDIDSKGAGNAAFDDLFWDRGNVNPLEKVKCTSKDHGSLVESLWE